MENKTLQLLSVKNVYDFNWYQLVYVNARINMTTNLNLLID